MKSRPHRIFITAVIVAALWWCAAVVIPPHYLPYCHASLEEEAAVCYLGVAGYGQEYRTMVLLTLFYLTPVLIVAIAYWIIAAIKGIGAGDVGTP